MLWSLAILRLNVNKKQVLTLLKKLLRILEANAKMLSMQGVSATRYDF